MLQPRALALFVAVLLVIRYVLRIRVSIVGSLLVTLVVAVLLGEFAKRKGP